MSTTGHHFCFVSVSSFFLELLLCSSPVTYWTPTDLRSSSFSVISFCLFTLFMEVSRFQFVDHPPGDFMGGLMVTSSQRTYVAAHPRTVLPVHLSPQQPTTGPHLHRRPLDTHRQVWFSLLWGSLLLSLGSGVHKVLFVPSKSLWCAWENALVTTNTLFQ